MSVKLVPGIGSAPPPWAHAAVAYTDVASRTMVNMAAIFEKRIIEKNPYGYTLMADAFCASARISSKAARGFTL